MSCYLCGEKCLVKNCFKCSRMFTSCEMRDCYKCQNQICRDCAIEVDRIMLCESCYKVRIEIELSKDKLS